MHQLDEDGVEDGGEAGRHEAPALPEEERPGDDDGEVEEGEAGVGAAGDVDEAGDDAEVAEDLEDGVHAGVDRSEA